MDGFCLLTPGDGDWFQKDLGERGRREGGGKEGGGKEGGERGRGREGVERDGGGGALPPLFKAVNVLYCCCVCGI